jgi:hypothetical protein
MGRNSSNYGSDWDVANLIGGRDNWHGTLPAMQSSHFFEYLMVSAAERPAPLKQKP